MEASGLRKNSTTVKYKCCNCQKFVCSVNGDNLEIRCVTCNRLIIVKTLGIKDAVEKVLLGQESVILNLVHK